MMISFLKTSKMDLCFYGGILIVIIWGLGIFFGPGLSYASVDNTRRSGDLAAGTIVAPVEGAAAAETDAQDLRPTVTLTGKVMDSRGAPLGGVTVALSIYPFNAVTSDDQGGFSVEAIQADSPIPLEIFREGYFPLFVSAVPPSAAEKPAPVFTLSPLPPVSKFTEEIKPATGQEVVHIEADSLSYDQEENAYHAKGHVIITYADGVLSAALVDFYHKKNEAVAEGQVVLQSRDGDVLEGEKARVNIEKKTGVVDTGRAFMSKTHFYLRGDRIEKRSDATYFIANAEATACDGASPAWHLTGKELDVTIDGYGTLSHGTFYMGKIPVLYSPYLLFPVKTTRQSGLLLPERMAYSENKLGWDISIPFFWAISKDSDATFHQRYMSERGFQEGVEYRYMLNKDAFGTVYADFLNDSKKITETVGNVSRDWQTEQRRWAFYLNHQMRLDPTLSLRADIARVSDSFYFKDFSSHNYFLANYSQNRPQPFKQIGFLANDSLNFLESSVRLSKAWPVYNLTAQIKSTQDLTVSSNDGTLQKYPEITLSGIQQRLFGSRFNYQFSGVYDYYYRGQGQKGNLLDIYPNISMPFGVGDVFQITPFAGVRSLLWSRDDSVDDATGKWGNREVYTTGVTVDSEIHKVFDTGGKNLEKIRHGIRPEVSYIYSPGVKQENIPDFVTAATQSNNITTAVSKVLNSQIGVLASDQNSVTYAVTNTLMARFNEKGGVRKYVELLRFKVGQTYDFREASKADVPTDTKRRPLSNVNLEIDFTPFSYLGFQARNIYNVYDTAWTQANYDVYLRDTRGDSASIIYRYTQNSIEETNLVLKAVITKTLDLNVRLKRDHLNNREIERSIGFDYRHQCWAVGFDYGDRVDGAGKPDRTYAFRLSLAGF